jgi:hypothetical protein
MMHINPMEDLYQYYMILYPHQYYPTIRIPIKHRSSFLKRPDYRPFRPIHANVQSSKGNEAYFIYV